MRCLRCGYCCHNYMVVIVDDPALGISDDNLVCHEGDGPCKHLRGDKPGEYSCVLHDYSWYKETPCYAHGQLEKSGDDVCRMGEFVLANPERFANLFRKV